MVPHTKEAYQLLHDGSIALAEVEHNGIRIDTDYLEKTIQKTQKRIDHLKNKLKETEVIKIWKGHFKGRTNINSTDQLGYVLFELMKFECPAFTKTGRFKTDEETLGYVDHPFVKDYLKIKKFEKALVTNLIGIQKEVVNGFMHPSFNLHLVRTFRSSSQNPNFQNIPVRDLTIGKMIRQAIIPRPGRRIAELDYSGIEVAIAACYHQDPTMIEYLEDKSKDMHRDMAMECFCLPIEEMTPENDEDKKRVKRIRYCGKNMFVFPQFYGDWYIKCAKSLWEATNDPSLCTRDGKTIRHHLRTKGIKELGDLDPNEKPRNGTFEKHIQKVEQDFWNVRFPVYNKWKKKWWEDYQKKGWMITKTGFICQGLESKNKIINYPVQGSAFHCLLRSLIRLQEELKNKKMSTLIIGQIHDSIVADVPDDELQEFLQLAHYIMVDELKKKWKWINVPIEIEAEVTPVNGNWHQKKEMKI